MKAAVVSNEAAAPEYAEFADPAAADGRELVELVAAGIHPIVRSLAAGRHYGSTGVWPMIPGVDAVARTSDGELVYTGYPVPPYGTLAERISVPAGVRLVLPPGADPVPVAAGLNPGLSSWLPLTARVREVSRLGTVLVLGGTGMAGLLAVQNARVLGAERVVTAGRSEARLGLAADRGSAAAACRRTRRTSPTCRSARWPGARRPCRRLCCAAGGSGSPAAARARRRRPRSSGSCRPTSSASRMATSRCRPASSRCPGWPPDGRRPPRAATAWSSSRTDPLLPPGTYEVRVTALMMPRPPVPK